MKVTKHLYLVKYKAPLPYSLSNWCVENYTLYAKDKEELDALIQKLPAHHDSTKEFLSVEAMPHGFNGGTRAYYPPCIEVDEEIQQ